jgi:glycerol-1-phosphate dehydrogenase [NAD(P)+]
MHGEQVGVGTIMMAYLHELNWKGIKSKLQRVGAPATSYELGVEPEEVIQSLLKANTIRPERYTILSEKNLNYEAAQVLAQKTGVI